MRIHRKKSSNYSQRTDLLAILKWFFGYEAKNLSYNRTITKTQQVLNNDIEIHFVEIPKLVKQWREEKVNPRENMSHDSSFRTAYEAREKLLLDEQAKIAHAREEGLEEGLERGLEKGLEEGLEKGKAQLIRGMHKNGMPLEDIVKFTGLSIEEIRKILILYDEYK